MHLLDSPIRSEELLRETLAIEHRFYASSAEPLTSAELYWQALKQGEFELVYSSIFHGLGYSDNGGREDLRAEIAKLYGPKIQAENIVVFPGAQTGMTLTAQAMLHEGDHAIVVVPSYQSLEEGAKLAGCDVTRVPLSPDNDWALDLSAVEAAIQDNTKYIAINDPHNPSGALMDAATKQELASLAEAHGIYIFSDEVYRLLEIDPAERSGSMVDISPNGIALATMSKPWGAGGTGIGWVVSQDKTVIDKLLRAQHIYAVCFSRAGEAQAMMALRTKDAIVGRNMDIIRENLALLDRYFADNSDLFEWVRPKAGGTGFVKFKGPLSGDELAAQLKAAGILVFGPSIFDCGEELKQYIRVGFSRRTMPAALKAFAVFVDQHRAQWGQP